MSQSITSIWDKVNKLNSAEVDKYFQSLEGKAEQKALKDTKQRKGKDS
jgi:hypothetical protein